MNTENLVNLNLTDTQLANVDAALATLETELAGLISLTTAVKRRMRKLGVKGESFSRAALQMISQNPTMIPANIPVQAAIEDLRLMDQLRPRLYRLGLLFERGNDTNAALGNDIMTVALQAYGLLKLTGANSGMAPLRRELSVMFKRSPKGETAGAERKAA